MLKSLGEVFERPNVLRPTEIFDSGVRGHILSYDLGRIVTRGVIKDEYLKIRVGLSQHAPYCAPEQSWAAVGWNDGCDQGFGIGDCQLEHLRILCPEIPNKTLEAIAQLDSYQ